MIKTRLSSSFYVLRMDINSSSIKTKNNLSLKLHRSNQAFKDQRYVWYWLKHTNINAQFCPINVKLSRSLLDFFALLHRAISAFQVIKVKQCCPISKMEFCPARTCFLQILWLKELKSSETAKRLFLRKR